MYRFNSHAGPSGADNTAHFLPDRHLLFVAFRINHTSRMHWYWYSFFFTVIPSVSENITGLVSQKIFQIHVAWLLSSWAGTVGCSGHCEQLQYNTSQLHFPVTTRAAPCALNQVNIIGYLPFQDGFEIYLSWHKYRICIDTPRIMPLQFNCYIVFFLSIVLSIWIDQKFQLDCGKLMFTICFKLHLLMVLIVAAF